METPNASVAIELYELALTERKDDRFGRVIIKNSLTEDDLVRLAVTRRTDLNASTIKACLGLVKDVAMEEVLNGSSVQYGLSFYQLGVDGVFYGNNAVWDSSKHCLVVNSTPIAELRQKLAGVKAHVRGMASSGIFINSVTDVTTKLLNSRITPGGGVNITGSRIKIAGDSPDNGLALINQANQEVVRIPMTAVLINDPSKLSFIVPASLPVGDYKLAITTQFSNSGTASFFKEPRTFIFDFVLNVLA